jgi:MoaA/NifB/PqqE/SkfB family radical SAM enzyme
MGEIYVKGDDIVFKLNSRRKTENSIPVDYGMYIHWVFLTGCNFSCPYCLIGEAERKQKVQAADIERISERLNRTGETILITFTGGEPLLIPNFAELAVEVTKKHLIRIDTNLSVKRNYEKILADVDPERVWEITFSTHVEEREALNMELDELCDTVRRYTDRGFRVSGNYVAYPPMMGRIEKDLTYFRENGVKVTPTFFWGYYNDKFYPIDEGKMQYSPKEVELIQEKNSQTSKVLNKSFGGICMAGSRGFLVDHRYNVYPCGGSKRVLGNFFNDWNTAARALTCCVDFCHGPFNRAFDCEDPRTPLSLLSAKTGLELGYYDYRKSLKYFLGDDEQPPRPGEPISRSTRHRQEENKNK